MTKNFDDNDGEANGDGNYNDDDVGDDDEDEGDDEDDENDDGYVR